MFRYLRLGLFSIYFAIVLLGIERLAGIGWDYSVDAVTYVNISEQVFTAVKSNLKLAPNNGYYVLVALMQSDVWIVTCYNLLLFGLTSMLLAKAHWDYCGKSEGTISLLLMILVLNPYRMHLATTILKDTTIIFLLTLALSNVRFHKLAWGPILIVRLASVFYGWIYLKRKTLCLALALCLIALAIFYQPLSSWLAEANKANMRFREYDQVPNFLEFGYAGIFVRALIWPLMLMSGTFIVFSPSPMLIPIAIGSIMMQIYSLLVLRQFAFTLGAFFSMAVIAGIVSGFTTYVRYCYPILVVLPILVMRQKDRSSWIFQLKSKLLFMLQPNPPRIPNEVVPYGTK